MKNNKREIDEIRECFFNIVGYITMILEYDSYRDGYSDYQDVLKKITKMLLMYEETKDITLINEKELLDLYNKVDNLQTKFICDSNMDKESELCDYVVNWMWDLMYIRKTKIEGSNNG